MHFGYTGLLNFGQIAFAMLGGFGIAISVSQWGLPFWVGVLVGVAAAVVLALLLGLPTLRLRADYLAIVTIATAEGHAAALPIGVAPPRSPAAPVACPAFNGAFIDLAPWDTQHALPHPRHHVERRRAVGGPRRLDRSWPCSACSCGC